MVVKFELKKLTDREIRIVIYDQDKHSLPNLIAKLAAKKQGVTFAGYIIEHPMISYPEVVILTDGSKNPVEVLKEVVLEARGLAYEFLDLLNRAIGDGSKKGDKDTGNR